MHYILKKIEFDEDYEWTTSTAYRFIAVTAWFNEDKRLVKKLNDTLIKDHLAEPTEQALEILLQASFEEKHPTSQRLIISYLRIAFQMGITPIEDLAHLLLTEANYRDVECLDEFTDKLKEAAASRTE